MSCSEAPRPAAAGFRWVKLGRVFCPQEYGGPDWMSEFAQAPATLLFDDFVRVYFSCRPPADSRGQYVSYSAFVDLDRSDLFKILRVSERPILDLGGLGAFDEFGTYPVSVIRDGDRILAYYGGWTRCESVPYDVAIGIAESRDGGRTFVRCGSGPVLGRHLDEPMTVSGPKIRRFGDRWYLFYVAGRKWKVVDSRPESIFRIRLATSNDGVRWTRVGRDLVETVLEEDECQASPDVIFLDGRFRMFFSYKYGSDFRNAERGYRIGHAWSHDLLDWIREDDVAGIDRSAPGEWDSDCQAYPHAFGLDGETYLLYLGNEVGRYGFGLARLERNSLTGKGSP